MADEAHMAILIPVSVGELFDRLSILIIKSQRIPGADVEPEIETLSDLAADYPDVSIMLLLRVNERLWDIENRLREKEAEKEFGLGFVELARNVYLLNDERAKLKRQINEETQSALQEIKQYSTYRMPKWAWANKCAKHNIDGVDGMTCPECEADRNPLSGG